MSTHATFREDLERAGFQVREYEGRNYYRGPAVNCDDCDDLIRAIRATTVAIEIDQLGKYGFVLYPRGRS